MDNNNLSGDNMQGGGNPYENNITPNTGAGGNDLPGGSGYQQPYQTQPQQTYTQGGYYAAAPAQPQKASGLAIASMVCGIISIVICCVWYLAAPLSIAAIVMGIINNVTKKGGTGMAIAGIVTGAIGLLLVIALFAMVFAGIYSGSVDWSELMTNY